MPSADTLKTYSALNQALNRTFNPFVLRSLLAHLQGADPSTQPLESNASHLTKIRAALAPLRDADNTQALETVQILLSELTRPSLDNGPQERPFLMQADVA